MEDRELEACIAALDRGDFIDNEYRPYAIIDAPLKIGHGQTISQPSLVKTMTELLDPEKDSRVLEVGTGSGYQTAILACLCDTVYTLERIPELSQSAEKRLTAMGYRNIRYYIRDGSKGLAEHAPYDRIMVTAAGSSIPKELMEQLSPGGRMVIPAGPREVQDLYLVMKDEDGIIRKEVVEKVRFVELKGEYGFHEDGSHDYAH